MSDPTLGPLKPQDTIVFLLGEMKGELRAIREGQVAAAAVHAADSAANTKEHEEFRALFAKQGDTIGAHDSAIKVIQAALVEGSTRAIESAREKTQKWMARLTIPAVIVGSVSSYLLSKYTP